ncbi:hypothetical protein MMC32_001955 [Xylographa parallela]|nr:hypothetical protein [Xylographa parallela]
MKSSAPLLSCLLFATNLLAAFHGHERRNSGLMTTGLAPDNAGTIQSLNWAGVTIDSPAGEAFNYVHGVFTVGNVSPPPGSGDGSWGSAAWIGLGGVHSGPLFQAVIESDVNSSNGNTMQSFSAGYEWVPGGATFVDVEICAGDKIALTVSSNHDGTNGTIIIKNLSNGQHFRSVVTMPAPGSNLLGDSAEWIVEDYISGAGFMPFADFGTVNFTDCVAKVGSESFGVANATLVTMYTSGAEVEANATVQSSSSVQVTYLLDGSSA